MSFDFIAPLNVNYRLHSSSTLKIFFVNSRLIYRNLPDTVEKNILSHQYYCTIVDICSDYPQVCGKMYHLVHQAAYFFVSMRIIIKRNNILVYYK